MLVAFHNQIFLELQVIFESDHLLKIVQAAFVISRESYDFLILST